MKTGCALRFGEWSPPSASELAELEAEFANDVYLFRAVPHAEREQARLRLLQLLPEELAPDVNAAFEAAVAEEPLSAAEKRFVAQLARLAVKATLGRSGHNPKRSENE